jgi:N-methylhydantoinase A
MLELSFDSDFILTHNSDTVNPVRHFRALTLSAMRIGIDIGGTFTDFVVFDDNSGAIHTYKRLSTPYDPAQAVLDGLAFLAGQGLVAGSQPGEMEIVHGSTVATNALLERKGALTALVTTAGFGDVLAIGRQARTGLYDLFADRPEPLVPAGLRLEVAERIDRDGATVQDLDPAQLAWLIQHLHSLQAESVAVCLLFSFANPSHEQQVAQALRDAGFLVSASWEILPEFREYERTSTTVINAYVSPVLDRYLGRLQHTLADVELRIMQSNGGSISAHQARRHAVRSIFSGPAGGVVGAFHVAVAAGLDRVVTFDMGGTSTDVSLCDGGIQLTSEAEIGGLPVRVPVIDIHTVGAGGGSIAAVDAGGALRVGPQSAGADPGPVCYGAGGNLPTVTDANLVLGRLAPSHFLGGRMGLDRAAAEGALAELAAQAGLSAPQGLTSAQAAALGVVRVANAHMERALRVISVERGHDPEDFALVTFGGAGGLHACDLARALGIRQVVVAAGASTLSAFGMLAADVVKDYVQTVMMPGTTSLTALEQAMQPLIARARQEMAADGLAQNQVTLFPEVDMRYVGQSYELAVPLATDYVASFHAAHQQSYGHSETAAPVEIVNLRLRAVGAVSRPMLPAVALGEPDPFPALLDRRPVVLGDGLAPVPFYDGARLRPGHIVPGPGVVVYPDTTVLLERGDRATVDPHFNLIIRIA